MKLSNTTYDRLSWGVRIFLPAVSALYFGLAQVWGLPAAEQVIGTIALVSVFIGSLIGLSNRSYEGEGQIITEIDDDGLPQLTLKLDETLEELVNRKQVVLQVHP